MLTYYCDKYRHLVCVPYSIENLHIMANDLNINKVWFHKNHYDIPKKRIEEINKKCILVDAKSIVEIIKDNMKAKLVSELLKEYGGAGFSYGGGSSLFPSNRGGQSNKGGFGGAANLGGPNMMYTYEIKPLNKTLEPEVFGSEGSENIHPGLDISGQELNKRDGKLHVGTVLRVVKSENGSLKYYIILNPETAIQMKIDPTTATLISKLDGIDPILGDQLLNKEDSELLKGEIMGNMKKPRNIKAKLVKESLD